jgi:hypothetical protein
VLGRLTTWMRADLLFHLHDLAEGAGISTGAAGRALASLDALGALQYQAGSGRGRHSAIALAGHPVPVEAPRHPDPSRAQSAEPGLLPRPRKVHSRDTQRSTEDALKGGDPRGSTDQRSTQQMISPLGGRGLVNEANEVIEEIAHRCDQTGKANDATVLRRLSPARTTLARALAVRLESGIRAEELIKGLLFDYDQPWPAGGAQDANRLLLHRLAKLPAQPRPTRSPLPVGPAGDLVARLTRTLALPPSERDLAAVDHGSASAPTALTRTNTHTG